VLGRLYRRLGPRYFALYVVFEFVSAFVVCLATVGILSLYTETSPAEFWRVAAVADLAVMLAVAYGVVRERKLTASPSGSSSARRSGPTSPRRWRSGCSRRASCWRARSAR
jgi:hypothetical protein